MRTVLHTADEEVLLDLGEEHSAEGLHDHLVVWTSSPFDLNATAVSGQYDSDQSNWMTVYQKIFWHALKQHNSAINSGSISTYLTLSNPEGIALTPYGQMVWLQSASSFCPVSWRHSDSTGGLSTAAVLLIIATEQLLEFALKKN